MNDSSFLNSHQVVGYIMVSDDGITKAAFLPLHTTNLQAELVDFTRAFWVIKNTTLKVYRDSKYALYIQLTHTIIWKRSGILNTRGNWIINFSCIHDLLKASLILLIAWFFARHIRLTPPLSLNKIIKLTLCPVVLPFHPSWLTPLPNYLTRQHTIPNIPSKQDIGSPYFHWNYIPHLHHFWKTPAPLL